MNRASEQSYRSGGKNPFLPLSIYIPDGEPKLFDGRVYLYGSKDYFGGEYCCHKYHAYSAPADDLTQWTDHGPISPLPMHIWRRGLPMACRGRQGFSGRRMW